MRELLLWNHLGIMPTSHSHFIKNSRCKIWGLNRVGNWHHNVNNSFLLAFSYCIDKLTPKWQRYNIQKVSHQLGVFYDLRNNFSSCDVISANKKGPWNYLCIKGEIKPAWTSLLANWHIGCYSNRNLFLILTKFIYYDQPDKARECLKKL